MLSGDGGEAPAAIALRHAHWTNQGQTEARVPLQARLREPDTLAFIVWRNCVCANSPVPTAECHSLAVSVASHALAASAAGHALAASAAVMF